jgi:hypothetical protein
MFIVHIFSKNSVSLKVMISLINSCLESSLSHIYQRCMRTSVMASAEFQAPLIRHQWSWETADAVTSDRSGIVFYCANAESKLYETHQI